MRARTDTGLYILTDIAQADQSFNNFIFLSDTVCMALFSGNVKAKKRPAVEEDGYMGDVTPRYATQYDAKVAKVKSGG